MIDFIKDTIVERFIKIQAIHVYNSTGISVYVKNLLVCEIYFNSSIKICMYCHSWCFGCFHICEYNMNYDDFVDIDEFVGYVLCKVSYDK